MEVQVFFAANPYFIRESSLSEKSERLFFAPKMIAWDRFGTTSFKPFDFLEKRIIEVLPEELI